MKLKSEELVCKPQFCKLAESKEYYWFSHNILNGICRINKSNKSIDFIRKFENAERDTCLYFSIEKVNNFLVFPPNGASKIAKFNMDTCNLDYFSIRSTSADSKIKYVDNYKITSSFTYNNWVYMLPATYQAIIKYNVVTNEVVYIDDWFNTLNSKISKDEYRGYMMESVVVDNYAWICCGCLPMLIRIDLRDDSISYYEIDSPLNGFMGIMYDGNCFWLTGRGKNANHVVCWNPWDYQTQDFIIDEWEETEQEIWDPFWSPIQYKNDIYFFPIHSRHIYQLDKTNYAIIKCEKTFGINENIDNPFTDFTILSVYYNGEKVCYLSGQDMCFYEYNFLTKQISIYDNQISNIPDDLIAKKSECILSKLYSGIMQEGRTIRYISKQTTLFDFIDYIEKGI